jgi:hypothetical protein
MRNPIAVKIEGWRDSVKRKRKLHAVGAEYNKYEVPILVNVSRHRLPEE